MAQTDFGQAPAKIREWEWFRFQLDLYFLRYRRGRKLEVWCEDPPQGQTPLQCFILSDLFHGEDPLAKSISDKKGLFEDLVETCREDILYVLEGFPGLKNELRLDRDVCFVPVGSDGKEIVEWERK